MSKKSKRTRNPRPKAAQAAVGGDGGASESEEERFHCKEWEPSDGAIEEYKQTIYSNENDVDEDESTRAKKPPNKSEYKNGLHPDTKLRVQNCECNNSETCRGIVWQHAAMGNKDMTAYIIIPKYPAEPNTATGQHKIGFRDCIARHLKGRKNTNGLPDEWNSYERVSITHFPPEHRATLLNRPSTELDRYRIPLDVGRATGLTKIDLCKDRKGYFAAPKLRGTAIDDELGEAKRVHDIKNSSEADASISTAAMLGAGLSFGTRTNHVPVASLKSNTLKTPKSKSSSAKSSTSSSKVSFAVDCTIVSTAISKCLL
jgi:hypothetical protein